MEPIRSFRAICRGYSLTQLQTHTLQSLVDQRRGTLHPYWIQLALNVPYGFAKRLHDKLIENEWAVPDEVTIGNVTYESELTDNEVQRVALIELAEEAVLYRINAL